MSFIRKNRKGGSDFYDLERVVLGDSETFNVGQVIKTYDNAGAAQAGVAATPILGVLTAISEGDLPSVTGTAVAGTALGSNLTSVTTAATNTTTEKYIGWVDTSKDAVFSASVSGTLGTTNDSNKRGCRIDVNSAGTTYTEVLETTATRTVGTPANFYVVGLDPSDSSRLLVKIALSETDSVDE
jgi:hypothetical protein